jgi:hypothetical protein
MAQSGTRAPWLVLLLSLPPTHVCLSPQHCFPFSCFLLSPLSMLLYTHI